PNGDTPASILNHPALQGIDLPNTGLMSYAPTMVTKTLLITGTATSNGEPVLHAIDKRTGERLATVPLPAPNQYGMMTYLHEGVQYIVAQVAGNGYSGALVALRLP